MLGDPMLEMSDFYHFNEVSMKALFKCVILTGGLEDILNGTMSPAMVGQTQQLKWCADNWTFHTHVRYCNTSINAVTFCNIFNIGTAAQSFSTRLRSMQYQVTALTDCNECNKQLSQCLPYTDGWHVETSRRVAALNCCKIHLDCTEATY